MKAIPFRYLRTIFLAALFVFTFSTLSAPKYADAQGVTKTGHEFDYYSDATHTHRVGVMIVCSDGRVLRSGQNHGIRRHWAFWLLDQALKPIRSQC